MALTFRISNIPSDVSREDLIKDLTEAFPRNPDLSTEPVSESTISLRSLAPSPCGLTKEQVAIVTLNPVPSRLQEAKQVKIPMGKGISNFIASFDSHFIGLTPLNEISNSASFEYVNIPLIPYSVKHTERFLAWSFLLA